MVNTPIRKWTVDQTAKLKLKIFDTMRNVFDYYVINAKVCCLYVIIFIVNDSD